MQRRTFLQGVSAAAAVSALPSAVMAQTAGMKLKITDIKLRKIKLVRELGSTPQRNPAPPNVTRVGGETFIEISTDQGVTGLGPGASPQVINRAKAMLVGKDPLLIDEHAYNLFEIGGANVEIALWDLIGKAVNQPLWKLWGGEHSTLMPYASQHSVGNGADRSRMAQTVFANGWRAIKFRTHAQTLKEDVEMVETTRKVMGPDFQIMCDANQAGGGPDGWGGGNVRWDLRRAMETAKEYERLGVFWLEEPLPRWDFDGLAALTASTALNTAGGEGSRGLHEWKWMLDKKALDIMQFEITIIGPTIARQVSTLAAANNKSCVGHVSNGLGQIASGHLSASWSNAPMLGKDYPNGPTWEIFYEPPAADAIQVWEVYENPPVFDKATGTITLSDRPGLGMSYKKDLIQDA